MQSGIPIIFNHRVAANSYLVAAVLQARLTNPRSPIVLFHDFAEVPPELTSNNIQCIHVREYYGDCSKVAERWFNLSRNPSEYEMGSMQRWMILRNFMHANNISQCFAVDSDVLLFTDITAAHEHFKQYDFTLSDQTWSCAFFNNVRALDVFHDLVLELYERRTSLWWRILERLNIFRLSAPVGNLADTTLIKLFIEEIAGGLGFQWANTSSVIDGAAFCPDLRSSTIPCEMEEASSDPRDPRPLRKIVWQNGLPFGKILGSGAPVRFHSLHFRGSSKHNLLVPCFVSFLEHFKTLQGTAPSVPSAPAASGAH